MTQSEAFERQVVRAGDATVLRGKLLANGAGSTTPSSVFVLNGSSLGTRCAAMAAIYSRYRFKYIRVKFLFTGGSYTGAMGVYDDATGAEGGNPTTLSNVSELRASGTSLGGQTTPVFFEWKPADPSLWYYTSAGQSGSDVRLVNSGILYAISASATGVMYGVEVDYCLVYKGAVDVAGF